MEESPESNVIITVAIHGMYDNYPVVVTFTGLPTQIFRAVLRLKELGITPPTAPPSASVESTGKHTNSRENTKPEPLIINSQLCCPIHSKPLRQGRFGWYCTAPGDGKNGYCTYTWRKEAAKG